MNIKKILSNLHLVNRTVDQLEEKTDGIYRDYEDIEDCESLKCEEEKDRLRKEMGSCLNKLKYEERILEDCEENFHSCSGQFV